LRKHGADMEFPDLAWLPPLHEELAGTSQNGALDPERENTAALQFPPMYRLNDPCGEPIVTQLRVESLLVPIEGGGM
jgi:hypothetical protein